MKERICIFIILLLAMNLTGECQLSSISFRSNNQQLIEQSLKGAFIKVLQRYELRDTVTNERFGRDGKSYFNQIPFLGIETSRGLLFSKDILSPWSIDPDFKKYDNLYIPVLCETVIDKMDTIAPLRINLPPIIKSDNTCSLKGTRCYNDSTFNNIGLDVDSLSGIKNGWIIWITCPDKFIQSDSIRFISIRKDIEISAEESSLNIKSPKTDDYIIGGIYVTPVITKIGQINLYLSGILTSVDNKWWLVNPFINPPTLDEKPLTPVNSSQINNLQKSKYQKK